MLGGVLGWFSAGSRPVHGAFSTGSRPRRRLPGTRHGVKDAPATPDRVRDTRQHADVL